MTLTFLNQGRMYALARLGRHHEALSAGFEALRQREELGWVIGQAKTLADVAELQIMLGDIDKAVDGLARATSLLDLCRPTDFRYQSACTSLADAARAAELYELSESLLERPLPAAWRDHASLAEALLRPQYADVAPEYVALQVEWGLRLEQLGRVEEATARFQRCVYLLRSFLQAGIGRARDAERIPVDLLVCLAKVGAVDDVLDVVPGVIAALRAQERYGDAVLAHLAYGTALRAQGDVDGARRELIAAEQLGGYASSADRLAVQHALVLLTADRLPAEDARQLLAAARAQATRLWELRLRGVSMLREAGQRQLLEAERAVAAAAMLRDELTGVGNRRRFDRMLTGLNDRTSDADRAPMALLLVDVDEFKQINDSYSHGTGDEVLAEFGAILRRNCRPHDVATRFGGDEFAIFLQAELPQTLEIAERIRRAVSDRGWNRIALGLRVTVSIGVAAYDSTMTGQQLFDEADRNLYRAKREGRNQLAS